MRPDTQQDHMQRVARVVAQLQSELERTLSVGDMADLAAMSPFHVIRVFRQITGYTPAAMQTALRIQAAKRLMAYDGASVTDACFEVGFSSLGSFSQRFKELSGVSPSLYRTSASRVEATIERLSSIDRMPWDVMPSRATVSGIVEGPSDGNAFHFIGLFPPGPPRGVPAYGDARRGPGEFVIRHVPDGLYVIYCAVIAEAGPVQLVMPDSEIATGGGTMIEIRGGAPITNVQIDLLPRTTIITPIMSSLFAIPSIVATATRNHHPVRLSA